MISVGRALSYFLLLMFVAFVLAAIAAVLINSLSTTWHGTWLPDGWTLKYFADSASDHDLPGLIYFSFRVTLMTTLLALLVAFPAAYSISRNPSQFKTVLLGTLSLPMLFPPMTYGIPLATMFYNWNLNNTLWGIVFINLVPVLPFIILILIPFFEKIDPRLEGAARLLGAGSFTIFKRIIFPLSLPGILTASLLVAVKVISNFELTFLVSGANTQTLIVAVYNDAYGAGSRAGQQVDAMAVIYTFTTSALLIVALVFVSPKQFVGQKS